MSTATDILRALMDRVRREMFGHLPEKAWYSQQAMVKKALTYPAHWLHERHIHFTAERYREITDGIITTMVRKGNLRSVTFMGRYILTCFQEHMRHHDDTYYLEGKGIHSHLDAALHRAELRLKSAADPTVTALAEAHSLIAIGKRKPKAKPPAPEPDLFAAAKPQRKGKVTL